MSERRDHGLVVFSPQGPKGGGGVRGALRIGPARIDGRAGRSGRAGRAGQAGRVQAAAEGEGGIAMGTGQFDHQSNFDHANFDERPRVAWMWMARPAACRTRPQ